MTQYKVMAAYPDRESARKAINTLERSGVEAANVSLLGPGAEEATAQTDTLERDARITQYVAKHVAVGAAAGAVAGSLAGLVCGAVAFSVLSGPVADIGVWALIASGAVGGGTIGSIIAGELTLNMAEGRDLTFEPVKQGTALVAVDSDSEQAVAQADKILRQKKPVRVDRFDGVRRTPRARSGH